MLSLLNYLYKLIRPKSRWKKLKVGMDKNQVEAILGKPALISPDYDNSNLCYYQNRKTLIGYVHFDKYGQVDWWRGSSYSLRSTALYQLLIKIKMEVYQWKHELFSIT